VSCDPNAFVRSWGDLGAILRPLAERFLRAVASRNRFAIRYGVQLVELALTMVEKKAEDEARGRSVSSSGSPESWREG
jgi:hypothetical protein